MIAVGPLTRRQRAEHPYVGTIVYQGVPIDIENRRGSIRRGMSDDGTAWATKMPAHYGEVRGTTGADGDPVDVYIGPLPFAATAYVIQAKLPRLKRFDETKTMLGFATLRDAVAAFRAAYDIPGFYLSVTCWPIGAWIAAMDRPHIHRGPMSKPLAKARLVATARLVFRKDQMPGGLLAMGGVSHPQKLAAGISVELEHTSSRQIATEIAMDHLTEDPDYYERLAKVERQLLAKGQKHVKSYMRNGRVVKEYDADSRDARQQAPPAPRRRAAAPAEKQRAPAPAPAGKAFGPAKAKPAAGPAKAADPRARMQDMQMDYLVAPSKKQVARDNERINSSQTSTVGPDKPPAGPPSAEQLRDLVPENERELPLWVKQSTSDPDVLFKQAERAHELQLKLLNEGKGLDKAIGATVLRGDKDFDFSTVSDVVNATEGPVILIGPMKKRDRAEGKATRFDGWSNVTDLVRATVAVDRIDQMPALLDKLRSLGMKMSGAPLNRFFEPTDAGYRDLKLTVDYGGHAAELQLHIKGIFAVKEGEAHKLYEKTNAVTVRMKKEGRVKMTPEETSMVDTANTRMAEIFDQAWKKATEAPPGGVLAKGVPPEAEGQGHGQSGVRHYMWEGHHCVVHPGYIPEMIKEDGSTSPIYEVADFYLHAVPTTPGKLRTRTNKAD